MPSLKEAAIHYAELGYYVFPLIPKRKEPATVHGVHDATNNVGTVEAWWIQNPNYNIGVAAGRGLVVIDVDEHPDDDKHGFDSLRKWEKEHGELPPTWTVLTGTGSLHYWYHTEEDFKNVADVIPAIDVRTMGGYVVAPPSVHPNGEIYQWESSGDPADMPIAELSGSALELARMSYEKAPDGSKRKKSSVGPYREQKEIGSGHRVDMLMTLQGFLVNAGMAVDAIKAAVRIENEQKCKPPLSDEELQKEVFPFLERNIRPANDYTDQIVPAASLDIGPDGEYIPRLPAELSREFLLNPPPKNRPLVVNYLREGEAMLLSGPPKAGKSFLIVQLAIAIATGSRWLGMTCQKKTVLYIDAELSASMTGERIRDIRERMGISYLPENLHVINTKTGQKDQITLRDVADDFVHGIRSEEVVIVDPLYMFLNSDENDNSQMKKEMEQIRRIASIGVTVIVVHHMAKGTQAGKMSIDRASGAGVLGRFFDSILTLNLLNREATDPARPERVEADTRSFQQPMPVNLWFDGFHIVDTAGDLADRDLNDPKKTMTEQKSANDAGRLNHCYHWMKDNCMLQPDGSFTVEDMIEAYATNYNKRMARTTITGQLDRAGFVKYKGIIEETVGDKVTRRKKNLYVPDGLEDI